MKPPVLATLSVLTSQLAIAAGLVVGTWQLSPANLTGAAIAGIVIGLPLGALLCYALRDLSSRAAITAMCIAWFALVCGTAWILAPQF